MPQAPPVPTGRPAQPTDIQAIVAAEAERFQIPKELAFAVVERESGWKWDAVSPKGARGFFQLMPQTAADLGIDPTDPMQNIQGGLRYLRQQLDAHNGDVELALAAYNAGPGAVRDAGGVPAIPETQDYVRSITERLRAAQAAQQPTQQPGQPGQPGPAFLGDATKPSTIGPPPSWQTRVSRTLTPLVGMTAGGMAGATAGAPAGPVGAAIGAVVGAGAGAGGAELIQTGFEALTRPVGTAPPSLDRTIERVGTATQAGMLGEAGGRAAAVAAAPIVNRIAAPLKSRLEPYAQEAFEQFTPPGGGPAPILPAEVTRVRLLDVAQNVAEGSLMGGARVGAVKQARQELAEFQVREILEAVGPARTPTLTGKIATATRRGNILAFRRSERQAWSAFESAADGLEASTSNLDAFAGRILGERGEVIPNAGQSVARRVAALAGVADEGAAATTVTYGAAAARAAEQQTAQQAGQGSVALLGDTIDDALRAALTGEGPPAVPLTAVELQRVVSQLGKLQAGLQRAVRSDPTKANQLGLVKALYRSARTDLEETLVQAPDALDAYLTANKVSLRGNQQYLTRELRRMFDAGGIPPEQLTQRLLKRNNSTAITAVRNATSPRAFQNVQREALQEILRPNPRTGEINWGAVSTRIADKYGDETMQALFPGGQHREIKRIADLMLKMRREPSGGIGKMMIQLTQGGAIAGLAIGSFTGPSAMILITPWMLGRIFTNPTATRWLSVGLRAGPGTARSITTATSLAAFLTREREMAQAEGEGEGDAAVETPLPAAQLGAPPPGVNSPVGSAPPPP